MLTTSKSLKSYFRKGERIPTSVSIAGKKRKTKYINVKHAYISGVSEPLRMAAVYNKRVGFDVYGYFLTTDMKADAAKIWTMSRLRWAVEVMFRDLKQRFALGKLAGRSRCDAEFSICIPFAILLHIRLLQIAAEVPGQQPRLETIGAFVGKVSESTLAQSIQSLARPWNEDLRKRVAARRSEARIHKKPVNTIAGAVWGGKTYVA